MDCGTAKRVSDLPGAWAARTPQVLAVRDASHALDFAALTRAIDAVATQLAVRGVRPRDRLIIVSENNVATVVWCLAAQSRGAWPAIVNARVGGVELAAMCDRLAPRLLLYPLEHAPAARELAAAASGELLADVAWGRVWVECCTAAASAQRVRDSHAHDAGDEHGSGAATAETDSGIALLIFTSGTTAAPKAVMWSHRALLGLGSVLAESRQTSAGAVVTAAGPLAHIMGISNLMAALVAGATLHLMPRLESAALITALAAGEVTHLSLVPTAYARICAELESQGRSLAGCGLRYISAGGAPLDAALKARTERLLGLRLVNGYGMTECAPGSRTRPDLDAPAHCIGWPERGTEMKVVGGAAGEPGELWMRAPTMMVGYLGSPEDTAATLREDGWLATGDLAQQLPDGSYLLVGRKKELIIRSGFNVYPAEVEAALNELPQVLQSGVVGRCGVDGNEEIIAFVQLRPGAHAAPEELRDALRARIAPYKRPNRLVILAALPLGPTGKIWKARLAELAMRLDAVLQ